MLPHVLLQKLLPLLQKQKQQQKREAEMLNLCVSFAHVAAMLLLQLLLPHVLPHIALLLPHVAHISP